MLASQAAVREVAKKLKNCAADYIPRVVAQRSALVGLFDTQDGKSKILAMGELTCRLPNKNKFIVAKFGQCVRACNQTLTEKQEKWFIQAEPRLSAIWTKAIKSELQGVLRPSNTNPASVDELSNLAKLMAEMMLKKTTIAEDFDGLLRDAARMKWKRLARTVMKAYVNNSLDTKSQVSILLSDLPFEKSELADALTQPLLSAAQSDDQKLVTRIVTRLMKANVSDAETTSIYQAASQLDAKSKSFILLSVLPFPKSESTSELADALTQPLLSAAQSDDQKLVTRIGTRLMKANVSAAEPPASIRLHPNLTPSRNYQSCCQTCRSRRQSWLML